MDERCPICGDPDCDECVEAAHDYEDGLWECYEPEEDDFDCHKDDKGFCGKAGSEECEFECPYR